MKKIPPPCPEPMTGPKYWRSLDQLADKPEFRQWMEKEFPAGASLAPEGESRRSWMKLMSASFMLAGLGGFATGCRRPEENLMPFAKQPEGYVHGKAQHFATAMPTRSSAVPVVVKSYEGRPVKIEGNSLHPASNGGTDTFTQASILDLYDPDRLQSHQQNGNDAKPEAVFDALAKLAKQFAATSGEGLCFLAGQSSSASRIRLQDAIAAKLPKAIWAEYEPVNLSIAAQGYSQAFGADVTPAFQLDKAKRILSLDSDFVGAEADSHSLIRGFAKGRRSANDDMNRLYVVEALMTLTGGNADHRLRVRPSDVVRIAAQVGASILGGEIGAALQNLAKGVSETQKKWAEECAKDLRSKKGEALVLAGYGQPLAVHLIAAAINAELDAIGKTVNLLPTPKSQLPVSAIGKVKDALNAGAVDTLVILGGNPAYNAPVDVEFATAAQKAQTIVRLGYYRDETAELKPKKDIFLLTAAHYLESWGDGRSSDGTLVPVQPLLEPLFGGLTELELLARLLGDAKTSPVEITRETFKAIGGDGDAPWKKFLFNGFLEGSASKPVTATFAGSAVASALASAQPAAAKDFDLALHRDYSVDDGRYNNNGWLQEMPDPITKVTWENVIQVSPKTARDLGIYDSADADGGQYNQYVLKISVGGRSVEGPAWVQPGLADNTVAVALGYGRTATGRVGTGCGLNAYALFHSTTTHVVTGVKIERIKRKHFLGVTQEHGLMEGRPVVREANLDQFKAKPDFAHHMDLDAHLHYVPEKAPDGRNLPGRKQNLYEHPYDQNPETASKIHQWGMVIDLTSCVGCNSCLIACQSENNIPIVGKDQVARGREMHWMRIDRYYSSNGATDLRENFPADDPQVVMQPMLCQHCEAAPCESVCPVNATVHDEEGLNTMAYNRCIGTRYCANNCPYKVRRFNFFDYNKRENDYGKAQSQHFFNTGNLYKGPLGVNKNTEPAWEIVKLVKNPDVSVRMRGVMEKCTFCVQRIEQAKISQKVKAGNSGDVAVKEGAFKTACQQACPAEAIVFGNILDAESAVSKSRLDPRNYSVLGFLDTRPRVTYLARIRNPNPAMPDYKKQPDSLEDYHLHRNESPFEGHGHGNGQEHESKHTKLETQKGDA